MAIRWTPIPKDERLAHFAPPSPGTQVTPRECQALAVQAAWRGLGRVAPNPLVGAVIVDRTHRFLAAGAHECVGQAHAEANALAACTANGADLKGGTIYVTLEPCAHTGRTPACAPSLAAAGLAHVVYGLDDPNPQVDGRGVRILRAAGLTCELAAEWQPECAALAEIFTWNITQHAPFVALKVATTLDGVMARHGDRRAWITGPRARAYGHFLRAYYDAILIGSTTMLADNPTLDTREGLVAGRSPIRVVVDPGARALRTLGVERANILKNDAHRALWITGPGALVDADGARRAAALAAKGTALVQLPLAENGSLAPPSILAALAGRGITSVLLEGGDGLYGPFLAGGHVQRLHLFQAARLFGGDGSLHFAARAGALTAEADSDIDITPLANDWLVEMRLRKAPPS